MNKVSDILSKKGVVVVSVGPASTVLEALRLMADKNIGSVVVMENEKYVGIVTERDYSRKVILKGKHSSETKVSEIMSTDQPHITPLDTIEKCRELMTHHTIRYLPVFENGIFKSIISMSDLAKQTLFIQQATIDHLKNYINS